jgi:hypothetical protein
MKRLAGITFLVVAAAVAKEKTVRVDQLGWLAGCWERAEGGHVMEEQWMMPRGGSMLGVSRTVADGRTVAYEAMRIEERGEGLVFVAKPSGQPEATFSLTELDGEEFVFSNPKHDFPQRVIYRREKDGSLAARIEGKRDGKRRAVDFSMKRAPCASGEPGKP